MSAESPSSLYEKLAEKYHAKGKYPERDRFLILAADAAWNGGQPDAAEALRQRILNYNPNHLLRPYSSFAEALKSPDILAYVQQLRRGYPRDRALQLMQELDQPAAGGANARSEEEFSVSTDSGPGAGGAVFALRDDAKTKVPARPEIPPQLTQSQKLQAKSDRTKRAEIQAANWPTGAGGTAAAAPSLEPETAPGAVVGSFLFFVVALIGVGVAGYVFVWPFVNR